MEKIITKQEVINGVGKGLESNLKEHGFRFVKSKSSLIRKTKDGFDKIVLTTYDSYPHSHQDLFLQFSSRINLVQDIVNKFYDQRFMNVKYHKSKATISVDYKNIKNTSGIDYNGYDSMCNICVLNKELNLEDKFTVHNKNDIDIIVPLITRFVEVIAFDFFDENHDLNKLNLKFKSKISKNSHLSEKMSSLVLMKLTKDVDFDKKEKEYLSYMNHPGYEEDHKNAFYELINYLNSELSF